MQWIKKYKALYIKQTAWMHAALMELEIAYYLKQWDYYILLSQKSKCPSVLECVSVALCQLSLNLWVFGCMPYCCSMVCLDL